MSLKNTADGYGRVSRIIHWLMAIAIFAMFGLGLWMRSQDYYSPYYQIGPEIHQSVGLLLLGLLIFRLIWKLINPNPDDSDLSWIERNGARLMHWGFYGLLFVLMISGYLISTLDGRSIWLFWTIEFPSVYEQKGLEKTAGWIHWAVAWLIVIMAGFHVLAALFHHFVKGDRVLMRMLRGPRS